jgi:hypothetical protein
LVFLEAISWYFWRLFLLSQYIAKKIIRPDIFRKTPGWSILCGCRHLS